MVIPPVCSITKSEFICAEPTVIFSIQSPTEDETLKVSIVTHAVVSDFQVVVI